MPGQDYSSQPTRANWSQAKLDAFLNDPNVTPEAKHAAIASWYGRERNAERLKRTQAIGTPGSFTNTSVDGQADYTKNSDYKAPDKDAAARQSLRERIQQYVDGLQGDVSPNDPIMQGLTRAGVDAGQQASAGWGGGSGGISRLSDVAARRMALPYLQQRAGLAAQGMGLLSQTELGLGHLQQGADSLQLQRDQFNRQNQMQDFAAQQQQDMAPWNAIGGLLGLGGGIASAFVPQIGAAGAMRALPYLMQGGSTFFGGLGASGTPWNGGRGGRGGNGGTH